ncbi:MAG: HD domain-containing phosphohydrolase [Eubacteriales bacterium]
MDKTIFIGLVHNISLLLILSIVYNVFFVQHEKCFIWKNVISGTIIGFIGVLLMLTPVKPFPGVIFDTRSILISTTAMFFGSFPTIIATIIICVSRILIGGSGTLMGVLVTISTAAIGLIWRKYRNINVKKISRNIYLELYIVGIIVHCAMLICMLALPLNIMKQVFTSMYMHILLIYPIGSLFISSIILNGYINNQTKITLKASENKYKELYLENENKQTLLRTLIDSVPDLIFYKDIEGIYNGCNTAFEKFAGKTQEELRGLTDREVFNIEMAEQFINIDKKVLEQKKPSRNDETVTYPDGTKAFLDTLKTPYYNTYGNTMGLIGISRDITERKKREDEILYLTYHDSLTGLYNRMYFDNAIQFLDNPEKLPLSVIIGDINGLKLINDALGHDEGDKLLIEVTNILKANINPGNILARIGGDEFGILLQQTDCLTVEKIVNQIRNTCEQYANKVDKQTYYASIALGYATKSDPVDSLDKIIKSAENFMYRRKLFEHKSLHSSILSSIKTTMYEKSHETELHTERLTKLSRMLGKALNLSEEKNVELELLSVLHDIGKIGIDDSILTKPYALSKDEWYEMKKHSEIGYRIALASPELSHIADHVLSHHERWDGKGYPQGLTGHEIPLNSRIIAIVDAYDAMINDRVYRKAISQQDAKDEIMKNAGTQFDPYIAKVFVDKVI